MSKFTVTTNAGDGPETPNQPIEFPDTKSATDDAQVALSDMAREKLPNGKRADFAVSVEDDTGKEVYRAGLSFTAKDENDLAREREENEAATDDVANCLSGRGPRK